MPLPYPHRATFLASTLVVPLEQAGATPFLSRLLSLIVFDHFVRHPIVTLGDDDERLADDDGRLLDASHPQIEDIDRLAVPDRRAATRCCGSRSRVDRARPQATLLHSRLPNGITDEWTSSPDLPLSQQLSQCLAQWLDGAAAAAGRVAAGLHARRSARRRRPARRRRTRCCRCATTSRSCRRRCSRRCRGSRSRTCACSPRSRGDAARTLDPKILELDPEPSGRAPQRLRHRPRARRRSIAATILPLVAEAPMYGKPHLSIWGEPFAADRPLENMGVRHQGIAASLMPANPYACHNYSLQLAEVGRREESYRWADRATVAAPQFGAAHLDCVRRLRQVGRPGQAFAEAQYRCREILDRAAAGKLPPNDWQAPHHAALLIAFAHLDIGRLAEAIELADEAIARAARRRRRRTRRSRGRSKRISHWKTDAGLLARAYAWEGYHRGDPGPRDRRARRAAGSPTTTTR